MIGGRVLGIVCIRENYVDQDVKAQKGEHGPRPRVMLPLWLDTGEAGGYRMNPDLPGRMVGRCFYSRRRAPYHAINEASMRIFSAKR